MVRHSGEIPEIALHSAPCSLTEAGDGPRLTLSRRGIRYLQRAATLRFWEIVLRDMWRENFDKAIFRGLGRSMVNFRRYETFLARAVCWPGLPPRPPEAWPWALRQRR